MQHSYVTCVKTESVYKNKKPFNIWNFNVLTCCFHRYFGVNKIDILCFK